MRRFGTPVLCLGLILLAACASAPTEDAAETPEAQAACDRACLEGMIDDYLDALVAGDPDPLPLSGDVRFTEDTVALQPGEGLWAATEAVTDYRQDILDTATGTAASMVVVEEAGTPVLLMLRMKVENREITEIETVVTRSREEGILFNLDGLATPTAALAAPVPEDQRMSRDAAIRVANFYPEGLTIGSFVDVDAPFAPDAYRLENGSLMAGPGCSRPGCEDIKAQQIMEHPDLTSEVKAVDEELGIVLLRMNFGDTGSYGEGNALIVWEAFKVYGGQIHAVEAFMEIMPVEAGSGW